MNKKYIGIVTFKIIKLAILFDYYAHCEAWFAVAIPA